MRLYRFSRSSLERYIVVFTAIVFILVLAMGTFVYTNYYRNASEAFSTANVTSAENLRSQHENELQIMEDMASQLSLQPEVIRFKLDEKPTEAGSLKKQLYIYSSVSTFFDSVCYCYQQDGYVWNDKTSMTRAYFAEKACVMDEGTGFLDAAYRDTCALQVRGISGNMCKYYGVESPSAIYVAPAAPYYDSILVFFVGQSHLNALIDTTGGRSGFIIYNDTVIYSAGDRGFTDAELLAVMGDEGQKTVTLGGEKYQLTLLYGRGGFRYAVLRPVSVLYAGVLAGSYPALIVLLILSIPAAVLLTLIWQSLKKRMNRINTAIGGQESGYTFDSIESGISTLVSDNAEIRQANAELKKSAFVVRFLKNSAVSADEARACGLVPASRYIVAVCGTRGDSNEVSIYGAISAWIQASGEVSGCGITLLNTNRRVLLLFAESDDRLSDACQEIFAIGRREANEFIMALSACHSDWPEGAQAYIEADTAYSARFMADNDAPIAFESINGGGTLIVENELPRDSITRIEHAVRVGNAEEADAAIDELCGRLRTGSASLPGFKLMYNELMRIIADTGRADAQRLNSMYNVFTLSGCLTLNDLNRLLKDACHEVMSAESAAQADDSGIVGQAIEYMQRNFGSPELTMSSLSDRLGISAVTLAVRFKSATAISPSDYLTNLRMNHAKQLLRDTDGLVKDISAQVGYEDEHVFMRRFKKYTNMTPGQYRAGARGEAE